MPIYFYHEKKNLKRIKKKKQAGDSEGNSSQLTPRTTIRSPTSELRLLKKFLICSKVKFTRKTRTRENFIFIGLRAEQTLKMANQ